MRNNIVLLSFAILALLSAGCAGGKVSEAEDNKTLAVQWYKTGNEDAAAKDFVKAVKAYTIAIKLDPNYTDAYINRGNAFIQTGPRRMAIGDFTKAIELQSNSSDTYLNRGYVYLKVQEFDKALQDFSKAIELDNKSAGAYLNRAKAFFNLKEMDKALKDVNKALELDAELANAYNFRGLVLMSGNERNNEKQAMTDFKKGCEKGDADACSNLKQTEKSMEIVPVK